MLCDGWGMEMKDKLVKLFLIVVLLIGLGGCGERPVDMRLIGLPASHFCTSESHTWRTSATHTSVRGLSDFFPIQINYESSSISAFAFVRVLETDGYFNDTCDRFGYLRQDSTVHLLSTVWNRGEEIPETFTIIQSTPSALTQGETEPTFLREGGVYLLPLIPSGRFGSRYADLWWIRSGFTVLFEVDNHGLIWSHSPFPDFYRFDGTDTSVIVDAILEITSCENFDAATSTALGAYMAWESRYGYIFSDANILTLAEGGSVRGRDLFARFDFKDFKDYTEEQIIEIARRAKIWHENNPRWPW